MKTCLLFPFARKLAVRMAATVEGMTERLMRPTRGMASVKVGKKFVIR